MIDHTATARTHAFSVGSLVYLRATGRASETFKVVRHFPVERGGPQYRLRSETTGQERVMDEALLIQL